ncbi:MAG: bifunctional DNA-formamidopyrimidine glycosylase/DNA-(apurinic or apyrimidinic site) lyase [Xanthomonadales bacterium]|jgi:formamidopyrimidine-DNA glycosylase|nr:bifunctional DNA-formamidopyrimidine glycosylase/DNA-(apurinic or apyrimidinic site) lyase [Xanthomonadales bacterium]
MPELPEVETTLRGIEPYLIDRRIIRVIVRDPRLRWPVPIEVCKAEGQTFVSLARRGKYLLLNLQQGGLIIHLGMSGSLRILQQPMEPQKHDHVDIELENGTCLRFNDPRRFGAFLWVDGEMQSHDLLRKLGPEPLSENFTADYLYERSRNRNVAIKNFIMNGHIVVGVGNIYASEALFMAGIHPQRAAGRVSRKRYEGLVAAIRDVLARAIGRGGTTLRDFVNSDGAPGYFAQELLVYDRAGGDCFQCSSPIKQKVIGQRSSYYCPACQR